MERKNHKNARIMEIYFSKSYIIYLVNNKEGIGNILKVKRKGNDVLIDSIANVSEFKILNDSVLIYTRFDAIHRPSKLWSHLIGSHSTSDKLLLYEKDVEYDLELGLSSSGKYVVIDVTSQNQNEIWVMNKLMDAPSVVYKRQKGRQIQLDHFGVDAFYVASISGDMY
ncbi:MAG: protease II, partial [Salibacteraceae bacterium]